MNFETLKLREDGGVLHVTLDNPPINLITIKMIQELFQLSGMLMQRADIKAVVMDSADPDFFIAHFDIGELEKSATDPSSAGRYPDINALQAMALNWQALPQVTIAKVDGRVRGGGFEFILAFDMRFATRRSLLCFPEASGYFLAAGGGTTRTTIMAGHARALEILLSARDFSGEEMERYGIINRALGEDEIDAYLDDLLGRINARTRDVIAMHRAVQGRLTAPMADHFFAALAAENDAFREALAQGKLQASAGRHLQLGQNRENELDLPATIARINADLSL
ncbi:enoyl-CoA hydratase/isomerase family protein [Sphingobium sp. Sx8-8]|uniref:enoyl-CoA hydratase/isomerase family protein n=1 Tax=Sphingobium sp. Sx8-8 TaxID=2933617 RepID=UPI001F5634D9|nr:enoyl-CoA hydratase/isomerase family protein [Sphingobium sp. Sx8-8]